jgi:hypothetical protein
MTSLTTAEIDRQLASRTGEVAELSSTLVELDNHPGLDHVRRYSPTGVTAQRWEQIQRSLAALWADLGSVTSILESAQAVRGRRSKLGDDDRAELTRLLTDSVGLADTLNRMHAACPAVAGFLDEVDQINAMVAAGITPSLKRLDAVGAAAPSDVADLLGVSATDPLSLTAQEVQQRIATIADGVDRQCRKQAELAALQSNWPEAVAATAVRLDALRDARERAAQTCARTQRDVVSGPLPALADSEPGLRIELESLTAPNPKALQALQRLIDSALQLVRRDEELAQGLLDRRSELTGRLKAYEAKAARLGLGEDRDLLSSSRIASGLLSRRPCDLRAVTRAVADYQHLVAEKRGSPR